MIFGTKKIIVDKKLPFLPSDMHALVLGVQAYEKFIPWVQKSKIVYPGNPFQADLTIGFGPIHKTYRSNVEFYENLDIKAMSPIGVEALWTFCDIPYGCHIKCCVSFSLPIEHIAQHLTHKIMNAFEMQAHKMYKH